MAKNPNKPRPGTIFRFDWILSLEKLSAEGQSRFLMGALYRGLDPSHEIDLEGLSERDSIRLETLWEQAAPIIDSDGEGWATGVNQRRYAGYSSGCKRRGEIPLGYEDYMAWRDRMEEIEPGIVLDS